MELKLILDNVCEGIITHTDEGIGFFNETGYQILNHCVSLLDIEDKDKCLKEIVRI